VAVIATITAQTVRPLANAQWEAFAQAVARGETTAQAALSAGYSSHTAGTQGRRLKSDIRIATRILAIQTEIVAEMQRSVAPPVLQAQAFIRQQVQERGYRLAAAQEMVDRFRCLFDARAAENRGKCPGGESGLHVRTVKGIGSGPNFREVIEYTVDRGAIAEFGSWLDRAAIECGDRDEKQRLSAGLGAEHADLKDKSLSELEAERAILLDARAKIEALRAGKTVESQRVIESAAEELSPEVEVGVDIGPDCGSLGALAEDAGD
jgi:hypothetical protein